MQEIVFSKNVTAELNRLCDESGADRIFLLTDETTERLCRPLVAECKALLPASGIVIGATDVNKTLDTLAAVWKNLSDGKASRRSLLINLGGGMVTDLGGFAAATFKRGIAFFNIPTTLLSMVDAAVGGALRGRLQMRDINLRICTIALFRLLQKAASCAKLSIRRVAKCLRPVRFADEKQRKAKKNLPNLCLLKYNLYICKRKRNKNANVTRCSK